MSPVAVGANVTGTDTEAPVTRLVPTAGSEVTLKGAAGPLALVTVVVPAPVFETLTLWVTLPPTGTSPKSSLRRVGPEALGRGEAVDVEGVGARPTS